MENREIARILAETADLMEIAREDPFRIRSYRNGAATIEAHPERVEEMVRSSDRPVTSIPGIGKGLAAVLQEVVERGSFQVRDQLLEKYPPSALELLKIQGLGPKSIALLFERYRVTTVDELERICREQKLRELPRMGAKLEEKVLRSIEQYRHSAGRFLLSAAHRMAHELTGYLAETPGVDSVTPTGSLRRGKETVGDLDLLVAGPKATEALRRFTEHPKVHEVLGNGQHKASAKVGLEGMQVDVRAVPAEAHGAALLYFTGSKEHGLALRQRALRQGLSLNEYGLFREGTQERIEASTEEDLYERLGLQAIPPELRENQGEIDCAAERRLPALLTVQDMRGDLHMHTRESDGRATLEEMAEAALALGYEYLAITDHSKALAMANGLDERRVVEFAHRVREVNQRGLGIRVFSGLECDIRRDGEMDIAWDALAELDLVIGSVHSYMSQEPAEMTARLLRALECPYLTFLAHPTGRVLLHRDAYRYDFETVAAEAARRRVFFEVNASPERLDLHAPLLRAAKARNCRFVINTDAHHPHHLRNMHYGVTMARRGWLEAKDVINTYPLERFTQAIQRG